MASREPFPAVQVTARLLLRPWRPDDPADVAAAYEIYRHDAVSRWLGAAPTPCDSLAAAAARLGRWDGLADGVRGVFAAVPWGSRGEPVGSALLLALPRSDGERSDALEVGWHLHPDVWGRGFATEAARAMLLRAHAAGVREAHAVVHPDNARSLAVCDRLGMVRLGRTAEWYGVDLVDHLVTTAPRAAPS